MYGGRAAGSGLVWGFQDLLNGWLVTAMVKMGDFFGALFLFLLFSSSGFLFFFRSLGAMYTGEI